MLLYHPLCFTVCAAVLCPQTVHPTALLHPQGRTPQTYMDNPEAFGQLPMLTLQPDQEEKVHTPHGHMTVMLTSSRALCELPVHSEVLSDQYWVHALSAWPNYHERLRE